MDKTIQRIGIGNRVTFDSDDGIQAGYVNDLRHDLGNGELHAWVELEHKWPGSFQAVPVSAILTSDPAGPPSAIYIGTDWAASVVSADAMGASPNDSRISMRA